MSVLRKLLVALFLIGFSAETDAQESQTTLTLRQLVTDLHKAKSDLFLPYFESERGPEREGYGRAVSQIDDMLLVTSSIYIMSELCDASTCPREKTMACGSVSDMAWRGAEDIDHQTESWLNFRPSERAFGDATDSFFDTLRLAERVWQSLGNISRN